MGYQSDTSISFKDKKKSAYRLILLSTLEYLLLTSVRLFWTFVEPNATAPSVVMRKIHRVV